MANSSRASTALSTNDLAFNVAGVAYDYGIPNRQRNQELNCASVHKLAGKLEDQLRNSKARCPSLDGTAQEIGEAPKNTVRVLWVGMWIEEGVNYTSSALHKSKKNDATTEPSKIPSKRPRSQSAAATKKGQEIGPTTEYTLLSQSPNAIRVVVPLGKTTATYYGLINLDKDTGICEGVQVPKDEVFYFAEFRDDKLVNKEERRQTWSRIVRDNIKKDTISWARNYDKSRFDITPKRSLASEVVSLAASYSFTKDVEYLRDIKRLLETYDDRDAYKWCSEENGNIYKLVKPGPVLTLDEAQRAVAELKAFYPPNSRFDITATELQSVCQALRDARIALEYREVGFFVSEFVRCLRIGMREGQTLAELAEDTYETTTSRFLTDTDPRPDVSNDAFAAYVDAECDKLEAISKYSKEQTKALKDSQGSHVLPDSLPTIYATFGQCPDVDSAKLYASHMHRYNVGAVARGSQRVEDMLDDHVATTRKFLDKLKVEDGQDEPAGS